MNKITISLDLANMILGYLGKRPYEEVFQLVQGIQDEYKNSLPASVDQPAQFEAAKNAE